LGETITVILQHILSTLDDAFFCGQEPFGIKRNYKLGDENLLREYNKQWVIPSCKLENATEFHSGK